MLDKKYNHLAVEKGKYEKWKKADYFKSGDLKKQPYTIVLPPPNVTGKLHLGHAMNVSIQDIIIRYKRMQGYEALWQFAKNFPKTCFGFQVQFVL